MKILHISDIHLGRTVGTTMIGDENFQIYDVKQTLLQIDKLVEERAIEYLVIAGDVFNSNIVNLQLTRWFREWLEIITKKCTVLMVAGNHETVRSQKLSILSLFDNISNVFVADADRYLQFENFMLVPFLMLEQNEHYKIKKCEIAITHCLLEGCTLDNGMIAPHGIKKEIFENNNLVLLGDIHKVQQIDEKFFYCGSPIINTFGEVENEHGCMFYDTELGICEFIPLQQRKWIQIDDCNQEIDANDCVLKVCYQELPIKTTIIGQPVYTVFEKQKIDKERKRINVDQGSLDKFVEEYIKQKDPNLLPLFKRTFNEVEA